MTPTPDPAHEGDAGAADGPGPIRVVSGSPTDEETAAIAALFSGLLLEQAASSEPLPGTSTRTAWDRTRRALRAPWPAEGHWQDR